MRHYEQPTTVGILGTDTLAEYGLAWLLREEGHDARNLGAYPTGFRYDLREREKRLKRVRRPATRSVSKRPPVSCECGAPEAVRERAGYATPSSGASC